MRFSRLSLSLWALKKETPPCLQRASLADSEIASELLNAFSWNVMLLAAHRVADFLLKTRMPCGLSIKTFFRDIKTRSSQPRLALHMVPRRRHCIWCGYRYFRMELSSGKLELPSVRPGLFHLPDKDLNMSRR